LIFLLTLIQDISDVSVTGLESSPFVDKTTSPVSSTTSAAEPLKITSTTDRVYTPAGGSNSPVVINEGGRKKFGIIRDNMAQVVVWNPFKDGAASLGDFAPKDGYKEMICVEAGVVKGWVELGPGETWEGGQVIIATS
jgi:glucose-6-phosphate 1-epimerase